MTSIATIEATNAAKQLARDLGNFVNRYGYKADVAVFIEAMSQEHRTLQQSATGLMLAWMAHLASLNDNYYDLRNEHAVKVARMIRNMLEREYGSAWSSMPLI